MGKRIKRLTKNQLVAAIVSAIVVWALSNVTVETGPLMSGWQYHAVWFFVVIGWIAVSVALALLSLNLWAEFDAR